MWNKITERERQRGKKIHMMHIKIAHSNNATAAIERQGKKHKLAHIIIKEDYGNSKRTVQLFLSIMIVK